MPLSLTAAFLVPHPVKSPIHTAPNKQPIPSTAFKARILRATTQDQNIKIAEQLKIRGAKDHSPTSSAYKSPDLRKPFHELLKISALSID